MHSQLQRLTEVTDWLHASAVLTLGTELLVSTGYETRDSRPSMNMMAEKRKILTSYSCQGSYPSQPLAHPGSVTGIKE